MEQQAKSKTPFQLSREAFDAYAHLDKPHLPGDDLSTIQVLFARWEVANFGYQPAERNVSGLAEELGEMATALGYFLGLGKAIGRLSHIQLKASQKIRGFEDREYARAECADAIADICIFTMNLATALRIDFGTILRETAKKVLKRDWNADRLAAHEAPEARMDNLGNATPTELKDMAHPDGFGGSDFP